MTLVLNRVGEIDDALGDTGMLPGDHDSVQRPDYALANRVLHSQLLNERALLRGAEREAAALRERLAQADTQTRELQSSADAQLRVIQNYDHRTKDLERRIAELGNVLTLVKQGKPVNVALELAKHIAPPTVEEQAKARFDREKKQQLKLQRMQSGAKQRLRQYQQKMQQLENVCMSYEDEWAGDSLKGIVDAMSRQKRNDEAARQVPYQHKTLVAVTSGERIEYSLNFREHVKLTAPDDQYAEALIKRSAFGEALTQIRGDLGSVVEELKRYMDDSLRCLWHIFTHKKELFRPKDDFFRQIRASLLHSKSMINEYARRSNHIVKSFVDREKAVKTEWALERVKTESVECQCEIPPPIVDALRAEIDGIQRRIMEERKQSTERASVLEADRERAEGALLSLQENIFKLHGASYHALRTVFKHRFKWIKRLQDPLRVLQLERAAIAGKPERLQATFTRSLSEVVERDVDLLKQFSEYFTGDTLFGVDMTAQGNTVKARPASSRPQRPAPVERARSPEATSDEDSDSEVIAVGDDKRLEHERNDQKKVPERQRSSDTQRAEVELPAIPSASAAPPAPPAHAPPEVVSPMRRRNTVGSPPGLEWEGMQAWQQRQHSLWENKRTKDKATKGPSVVGEQGPASDGDEPVSVAPLRHGSAGSRRAPNKPSLPAPVVGPMFRPPVNFHMPLQLPPAMNKHRTPASIPLIHQLTD